MPLAISRLRLLDWMLSRGPVALGVCQSDVAENAAIVNAVQERIINAREVGEAGFYGSVAAMVFNVDSDDPYITAPRGVTRLQNITVCDHPVPIQNQFYEYLQFGSGKVPPSLPCATPGVSCRTLQSYDRGLFPTFTDLAPPNKRIRVYPTNAADAGLRTLISGKDSNDQNIFTLDGTVQVDGVMVSFDLPFADTDRDISLITGIQKDVTTGPVSYYEVDTITGDQRLLLTMEPSEKVAGYRRLYLDALPASCCSGDTVQVSALARLDFIPVRQPADYLLIQSLEAMIAEGQSMRMSTVDGSEAKAESRERHNAAIRLLQGQLVHQFGKETPAINFAPYGSAHLRNQRIGSLR